MEGNGLNPKALLLDDTEVKISIHETSGGRGYVHVRASLGLSRWNGVLPCSVTETAQLTSQDGQEAAPDEE